jgi:hypothetical protein
MRLVLSLCLASSQVNGTHVTTFLMTYFCICIWFWLWEATSSLPLRIFHVSILTISQWTHDAFFSLSCFLNGLWSTFLPKTFVQKRHVSLVSIVARLWDALPRHYRSNSGSGKRSFSSPKHPDWLCGPFGLIFNGSWTSGPEREANYLPPLSA